MHGKPSPTRPYHSTVVPVPMVHVGIMRMAVGQPLMHVRVCVRLAAIPRKIVRVLMMLVVHVAMRMRGRFMRVGVFVAFGQVKPDAAGHERRGNPEWRR